MSRRDSDAAADGYARRYGDALHVADSAAAAQVVDDALAAGLSGSEVQSLVIGPALVRIGELWAANAATVAGEHLATAISQGVMFRLFERLSVARAPLARADPAGGGRGPASHRRAAYGRRCPRGRRIRRAQAVNDTQGHAAGDRLLQTIGSAITETLRGDDFAARVGGAEFAVLLPMAGADEARAIARRIRETVSASTDQPLTVSIGVAPLTADIRGAVLAADAALYEAKRAGRDRVVARATSQPAPTPTEASS